jgi:hypothetical protein
LRIEQMALFKKWRASRPDPEGRSPDSGVKYKDLKVVEQLVTSGAVLTEPRHVLYYLYFSRHTSASAAADAALSRSFEVRISDPTPKSPGQWSLVCDRRSVVLDHVTLRQNSDFFETLAATYDGEYDGWEASVQ